MMGGGEGWGQAMLGILSFRFKNFFFRNWAKKLVYKDLAKFLRKMSVYGMACKGVHEMRMIT